MDPLRGVITGLLAALAFWGAGSSQGRPPQALWEPHLTGAAAGQVTSSLAGPTYPGACSPWVQVNAPAFGLPAGDPAGQPPYQGEEGFEALVFKGQLYLGMEADNQLGGRLWRSRPGVLLPWNQADWEEVSTPPGGLPFGVADLAEADHIDSLAEFGGWLYTSTAARGDPPAGARVFRSPDGRPATWQDAAAAQGAGFGEPANENFKDMQVFAGWLCGGTWNAVTGAQVWCTEDGDEWSLKNRPGFGQLANEPGNITIWSGHVYDGFLYFGVQNQGDQPETSADDRARLYRTDSLLGEPDWGLVFEGQPGSIRADLLGDLGGHLYLATAGRQGIEIWRSPKGDPGSWTPASRPGLDGNPWNAGTVVDGAAVYNGALYVGVINTASGAGIWRTTGDDSANGGQPAWEHVVGQGLGDPGNFAVELIPYNGHLYAWTSNYQRGQAVLRTACPVCQRAEIAGPGRYDFPALGAALDFEVENLESVEICHYPEAQLPGFTGGSPAPGYYRIAPRPASAAFSAGITLSPSAAAGAGPGEARLVHWTGQRWEACTAPTGQGSTAGEARCRAVGNFSSPWGIVYGDLPAQPGVRPAMPASSLAPALLGLALLGTLALFGSRRAEL